MNIRDLAPAFFVLFVSGLILPFSPLATAPAKAESPSGSWARFPGADRQGYVADAQIPDKWSDRDYSWSRELGSTDVGSPIVIDEKVYYMVSKPADNTIGIESLDLKTGKVRWSKTFPQVEHHLHKRNTFASSSPTANSEHVYIAWAEPEPVSYTHLTLPTKA